MFRPSRDVIVWFALVLTPRLCLAQGINTSRQTNCNILVRVLYDNDRPAGDQIQVELQNNTGIPVADTFTDTYGRVSFHVSFPGEYEIRVSGSPIQGSTSASIVIEDMDKSRTVFVHVKPKTDAAAITTEKSNPPPVTSASELRIPADAKKAFHRGMEAWERNDFPKAAEQFEKAVAIYPEYDTAFNNLGVMYYQMRQPEQARVAFERSVALNDKNADADRNLARILMHDGNFSRAEDLLKKSLIVEPLNPVTLTLMCVVEIKTGDDDGALVTARKVHQLPHQGYALVHEIAGQAYEHKGEPQNAALEYQTYLQESPNGAEASEVRLALGRLTTAGRSNPQ